MGQSPVVVAATRRRSSPFRVCLEIYLSSLTKKPLSLGRLLCSPPPPSSPSSGVRALNFFKRACAAASTTAAAFLCLTDERKLKKISRDRTNLRMRDLLIGHSLERIIKLYEF